MIATKVDVKGPLSWSYFWPDGPTEHLLNRSARALKRLTPREAPHGTYTITINGVTRRVVHDGSKV